MIESGKHSLRDRCRQRTIKMDGCDCSHGGILQVPEVTTHGKQIVLGRAKLGRQFNFTHLNDHLNVGRFLLIKEMQNY